MSRSAQLAEATPYLRARSYQGWPQAAATIHDLLLIKDRTAASRLRAEIKAVAETVKDEAAWKAWLKVSVSAIKEIRLTDFAAARAVFAELEAASGWTARLRPQARARLGAHPVAGP